MLAGIAAIVLINAGRVTLLLYSIQQHWRTASFINHHDLFNIVAYGVLLGGLYLYVKTNRATLA